MEQLKRWREARGLSQTKLAARADVNPATVNQIEGGKRAASPGTLHKLADALDVSLYELLEGEPSPKKAQAPLPLEERGAFTEDFLKLANFQFERFLEGENPKLVVGGLAYAVGRLVEWTKPPFEGEAEKFAGVSMRVLAEADPNSLYWPLERKRLEEGLENLEEAPQESRKE